MTRDKIRELRLNSARVSAAREYHGPELLGINRQDIENRMIPGWSTGLGIGSDERYKRAKAAYDKNEASDDDLSVIAKRDQEQNRQQSQGLQGAVLRTAISLPAIAGEMELGPAKLLAPAAGAGIGTRLGMKAAQGMATPALVAPTAEQRSIEGGGEAYDPKNLGPAALMAGMKNVILGTVGGQVGNVTSSMAGRIGAGAAVGIAENQVGDAALSALDKVLPDAYKTKTNWGTLGHALRGEQGEAWKSLAGDERRSLGPFLPFYGERGRPGRKNWPMPPTPWPRPAFRPPKRPR